MSGTLRVAVACLEPGAQWQVELEVPAGATVADAVRRSGLLARVSAPGELEFAVFGRRAGPMTPLANGDRVELTRPLITDAKEARKLRANATALAAKSRVAKPSA